MYPFPFSVTLHADHAQYVNYRTDGCGATPLEALEDALECVTLAANDDVRIATRNVPYPLPRSLAAEALDCDDSYLDKDICDEMDIPESEREDSDCYWYVTLELAD